MVEPMFASSTYEKIVQVWKEDQEHAWRDRSQKPIPRLSDVQVIIDCAFQSSLKREEDQPITFSIALLSEDDVAAEHNHPCGPIQVLMKFNQRLPFSVESITKLAVAFDSKTTALLVAPLLDQNSNHQIWGAIFFGSAMNSFNNIPVAGKGLTLFRPDAMIVTATSPGSILITRKDMQIGRFVAGKFIRATPSPFSIHAMGYFILGVLSENEDFKDAAIFLRSLDYLLSETSTRGHGGTIIIIPHKRLQECTNFFSSKYEFKGDLQLNYLSDEIVSATVSHQDLYRLASEKALTARLSLLAQLACLDGALVLNSQFEVIGFGATLNAPKWEGDILHGSDGLGGGGKKFDASKLGTRHNSAINFVGATGAIGFVVSQDGPVRGLAKGDSNTLLCWADCRLSMFV